MSGKRAETTIVYTPKAEAINEGAQQQNCREKDPVQTGLDIVNISDHFAEALIAQPNLHPEIYRSLLQRYQFNTRMLTALAKNAAVPEDVRDILLDHFVLEIRAAALATHVNNLSPQALEPFLQGTIDEKIWKALCLTADEFILELLIYQLAEEIREQTNHITYRKIVAFLVSPKLSSEQITTIVKILPQGSHYNASNSHCLVIVAAHQNTPPSLLRDLYEQRIPGSSINMTEINASLAINENTPPEIITLLAKCSIEERTRVKGNTRAFSHKNLPIVEWERHVARISNTVSVANQRIVPNYENEKNEVDQVHPGISAKHLHDLINLAERTNSILTQPNGIKPGGNIRDWVVRGVCSHENCDEHHLMRIAQLYNIDQKTRLAVIRSPKVNEKVIQRVAAAPKTPKENPGPHNYLDLNSDTEKYELALALAECEHTPAEVLEAIAVKIKAYPQLVRHKKQRLWRLVHEHPNCSLVARAMMEAAVNNYRISSEMQESGDLQMEQRIASKELKNAIQIQIDEMKERHNNRPK